MRRGLFVYCRRTLRRRQHNNGGATTGAVGEAQQAADGGVDDDGHGEVFLKENNVENPIPLTKRFGLLALGGLILILILSSI